MISEKQIPVFRKRSCANNKLKCDGDATEAIARDVFSELNHAVEIGAATFLKSWPDPAI
jgi:hypothetical protein